MSVSKFPVQMKAAAELELRRRHKERAKDCLMCDFEEMVNEVYGVDERRPAECDHTREQQDPGSEFNRRFTRDIEAIYGGGGTEMGGTLNRC